MAHLHIQVPAITPGTLARTHELKMISRKYKFHVLKLKIADFFEPSEIPLATFSAKSHSTAFLFGKIFNLTIFWVRENSIFPLPNTEILLILEDELFVELSTTSSLTDALCFSGTTLVPFAHSNIS